jgi:hypothetical protein
MSSGVLQYWPHEAIFPAELWMFPESISEKALSTLSETGGVWVWNGQV